MDCDHPSFPWISLCAPSGCHNSAECELGGRSDPLPEEALKVRLANNDDNDDGDDGDDGDGDDGIAEPVTPPTRSETTDFFNDLAQRFHTI